MKKSTTNPPPLKIGFQGWYLPQPHTGIGQASLGLLRALAEDPAKPQLTVVTPRPVKIPGLPASQIHTLKPLSWLLHSALKKWAWERVQVPAFFARRALDWEYYPYPCPLPARSPHPRAMTVHDTILWDDPRYAGGRLKRRYHRATKRALIHVDHVFTVSQTTQQTLGIPAATLLPNGLPEIPAGFKKMPYQNDLIYIGGYDLRKNVPDLIRAFALYHKSHPQRRLLLVGEPHHSSTYYPALPSHPVVHHLGRLSEKDLYSALRSSFALVHYSDSEGFNIPLLQAMAVGTPALLRDLPVNREVSHGAALFFKPSKKGDFTAKLDSLVDPKVRATLTAAAKKAAAHYSWKKTATAFLKALS